MHAAAGRRRLAEEQDCTSPPDAAALQRSRGARRRRTPPPCRGAGVHAAAGRRTLLRSRGARRRRTPPPCRGAGVHVAAGRHRLAEEQGCTPPLDAATPHPAEEQGCTPPPHPTPAVLGQDELPTVRLLMIQVVFWGTKIRPVDGGTRSIRVKCTVLMLHDRLLKSRLSIFVS